MKDELSVTSVKEGNTLTICAKGRINTTTVTKFSDTAKDGLDGTDVVILDFTELDYMSSAGIRVVLMILNKIGEKKENLIVRHPNSDIMDVLTITGFEKRITIEK